MMDVSSIRSAVRDTYGKYAKEKKNNECNCCTVNTIKEYAEQLGYAQEDVELAAASGANLGLGCGNPV